MVLAATRPTVLSTSEKPSCVRGQMEIADAATCDSIALSLEFGTGEELEASQEFGAQ